MGKMKCFFCMITDQEGTEQGGDVEVIAVKCVEGVDNLNLEDEAGKQVVSCNYNLSFILQFTEW